MSSSTARGDALVADQSGAVADCLCKLCDRLVTIDSGRQHGNFFYCHSCMSADRLLRRGLGDKTALSSLTKDEQVQFYQQLAQDRQNLDGRLNWETVKSSLLTTLTKSKITESSTKVVSKFLPLSVYLQQGWEREVVEACPSEFNKDLNCETYKVPVKSQSWSETFQEVEQKILQQERQASLKRGPKSETADMVADVLPSASSKETNTDKSNEKKAAKAELTRIKKTKTANQKTQLLASKSMGSLTADQTALQKLFARVDERKLEAGVRETAQNTLKQLTDWTTACKNAVQKADTPAAQEGTEALTDLPFSPLEVKAVHQSVVEINKALRLCLPDPKPKVKAKAKASGADKDKAKTKRKTETASDGPTTEEKRQRLNGKTPP